MSENIKQKTFREFKEFLYITLTTAVGSFGWCAFLLPHKIPIGGISGLASVIFWGIDIPIEYTYFILNLILLLVALKVLGWRFCIRTIYTVFIFATLLTLFQRIFSAAPLLPTNPFLSCIIGGILMGFGMGVALQYNASTGGSDVIAAMIHKYRNVSLGKIILSCDLVIITSSYLALHNWENVIYGFVVLFVMTFVVDYVANGMNGSVNSSSYLTNGRRSVTKSTIRFNVDVRLSMPTDSIPVKRWACFLLSPGDRSRIPSMKQSMK